MSRMKRDHLCLRLADGAGKLPASEHGGITSSWNASGVDEIRGGLSPRLPVGSGSPFRDWQISGLLQQSEAAFIA